jgi:hypothetical protein
MFRRVIDELQEIEVRKQVLLLDYDDLNLEQRKKKSGQKKGGGFRPP